ncbi:hypothetical protein Nepgr_011947 [Nepenthes gracilis]|uniref:Uncharacterized protein n=1 Tax=Nepenthes gracilis TaxID=150966 RepID=A0AAD3SGL7_NEPGR|nr:hypothetical protein Nepgr_011947 [Nepenthes gracilis]
MEQWHMCLHLIPSTKLFFLTHKNHQKMACWILLRFAASLGVFLIQTLGAHVQQLKEMGPINYGTVLLLMRNLSINPSSPDFEPTVFWALELLLKLFSLWWRKYYCTLANNSVGFERRALFWGPRLCRWMDVTSSHLKGVPKRKVLSSYDIGAKTVVLSTRNTANNQSNVLSC